MERAPRQSRRMPHASEGDALVLRPSSCGETFFRPPLSGRRFARFFITSMSGLVVGLLSPFSAFLRTPTLTAIGATLLFGILLFVYLTLGAMRSTPPPPLEYAAPSLAAQSVYQGDAAKTAREQVDPNMKRMLNDIYGDFDPGQ